MDDDKHWCDDDRLYPSGHDSDDSPLLSNRYEYTRRYMPYETPKVEDRERRSTFTVLAKFYLFCTAMILFCVLMYIPVYKTASDQLTKDLVVGWSKQTNRDTKIYVRPNNVTTLQQPTHLCATNTINKLFLLIVVCSSTNNFESRLAIRETWGSYEKYTEMSKLYHEIKEKYINYNYTYDLYSERAVNDIDNTTNRIKRDISSFSQLLPELAKALQNKLVKDKTEFVPEKRFDDDDNSMLPEFDMNQEIGGQTDMPMYDYYDTNVMKIPPRGYSDNGDMEKIINFLRNDRKLKENLHKKESLDDGNTEPEFKVVFLLGLPANDNDSTIQNKILAESAKYGDVIQEGFIDSYNNLTLKSIMMLKWITNNCNNSVRYILKTDDDMYINVPNLIDNLTNRSREFDRKTKGNNEKEYMLIGDLICGARPVLDSSNKWYSPRYMYGGRVYPKYLSGTGYALTLPTARALYDAALRTNYFHLEDIFITGMCSARAHPRIVPRDDPTFSYQAVGGPAGGPARAACGAHARATAHRVPPDTMRHLHTLLGDRHVLDMCERMRLTKVRRDRLKPKTTPKRLPRH